MARMKDNSPIDRERHIGRWAMLHNHRLFRVGAVLEQGREVWYSGTTLQGDEVSTTFPISILREEDEEWINGKVEAE